MGKIDSKLSEISLEVFGLVMDVGRKQDLARSIGAVWRTIGFVVASAEFSNTKAFLSISWYTPYLFDSLYHDGNCHCKQ